jgi:DnaJ-like protein
VATTRPAVCLEQMRRAPREQALFALLGVDENAPWEDVRQAFRTAVRANHPDLHAGDPDAERRLKALNAAWESINTPGKWAAYILQPASREMTSETAQTRRGAAVPSVGRLHVRRQRRGSAGLANWNLELDGEVIARIENGGVTILEAGPGRHSVRVFYGSHSSLPLQVELHRGQEVALGCRQLESVRINLFSPKRSLVLELLDSRGLG